MSHVLITFLGKGEKNASSLLYPTQQYHFKNDSTPYYEANFFGLAVCEHLREVGNTPDKLVILGTPSSMWNGFFEQNGQVNPQYRREWTNLGRIIRDNYDRPQDEKEEKKKIDEHLGTLTEVLSQRLDGIECDLRVISYGEEQAGQITILKEMADCVDENDTVSLDITHGLRHLPMLVVLSAMYLQVVKKVDIHNIYYGAKELENRHRGIAPALELGGLLDIANWVGALNSFEKDGDYAVFSKLLAEDELATAKVQNAALRLKQAAFFERIFNVQPAAKELKAFRKSALQKDLPGVGQLFTKELRERTEWCKQNDLYKRQRKLAYQFLGKEDNSDKEDYPDYPRAAIFAIEAFITYLMVKQGCRQEDIGKFKKRRNTKNDFLDGKLGEIAKKPDFELLKDLRNAMAHSDDQAFENENVKTIMESENPQQLLKNKLKELMDKLLP